jgi:hypothetical protein
LFIDFTGDKDFNDTLEQIYNAVIPKFTSVTGVFKNITIPEDMPIGLTRLRLMLTTNKSDNNACEISPEVLEVEDYGINVKKNRDSIPSILSDALSVSFDNHVGHDYLLDYEERYESYHRKEEKIEFAICGGIALAIHGFVRTTVDIDKERTMGKPNTRGV